jgi:hypothetical protein
MLSACANGPRTGTDAAPSGPQDRITVAVGPCFGFCPVYSASVTPKGAVRFDGQRHTAVLGERTRSIGIGGYRSLARDLSSFRPASGTTAALECTAAVSDVSQYTVTWIDAAGTSTTVTAPSRCSGGPGKALVELLQGMPDRLGVADWAKQTTRPGASRG